MIPTLSALQMYDLSHGGPDDGLSSLLSALPSAPSSLKYQGSSDDITDDVTQTPLRCDTHTVWDNSFCYPQNNIV